MPILIELFLAFVRIGLFTFGGGYAMISIIENICVEKKNGISPIGLICIAALVGVAVYGT